jgi:hypothetical protein
MRIVPYLSVAGVPFGSTEEDIHQLLGTASKREVSRLKRLELTYDSCVFRLSEEDGRLIESTANSEYFEMHGLTLPGAKSREVAFVELGYAVAKLDTESFLCHGFFVSPAFGLAFDPHFPMYLTVFAKSELVGWQDAA